MIHYTEDDTLHWRLLGILSASFVSFSRK